MTDEGLVVHMLIEKKYSLKKEILMQMLKLKLDSEEDSTMALELIQFIKKSWLVQDQTVLGKDYSNLLIADSLLKTIWFINAPCYDNEALASPNTNDEELSIPEQTATGKGTSNLLMAGSLPKTTKPTYLFIHQMDVKTTFVNYELDEEGEAEFILGIRIKHESNGIAISQSHYIEKVLKKFNYFDCTLVSTPMDTSEKLMPNNGQAVSQLEYSR
ncbi:zinc finger, CCHC-type containing protein [Tanacetum coccineum]